MFITKHLWQKSANVIKSHAPNFPGLNDRHSTTQHRRRQGTRRTTRIAAAGTHPHIRAGRNRKRGARSQNEGEDGGELIPEHAFPISTMRADLQKAPLSSDFVAAPLRETEKQQTPHRAQKATIWPRCAIARPPPHPGRTPPRCQASA
ncbi:hypothetical protein DB346_05290 [Verrucomicrobia bacterium LW23]|nr:hypothetical protein DB346_05290 [Verrucomicrobia bacterium LW23]